MNLVVGACFWVISPLDFDSFFFFGTSQAFNLASNSCITACRGTFGFFCHCFRVSRLTIQQTARWFDLRFLQSLVPTHYHRKLLKIIDGIV